jgi:membrane-associated phospholipid phosphatase
MRDHLNASSLEMAPIRPRQGRRGAIVALLAIALAMQPPLMARAQQPAPGDERKVTPRDTAHQERHQTLFTYRDAALAAGFVGLTFAMFPVDKHIAEQLQNENLTTNRFLEHSATGFESITTPGAFIIGGGLYAAGRLMHKPNLADFGWHGTEAVLLASGVTSFLKGSLGRSRPFVSSDTNPHDFRFGGGFSTSDRQSFPSGHTTAAFAAASAVTSEIRRLYPKAVWYVAPVMYGGATMVGLSRMYHNKHWASDVVLGAAVGTFSGLKVVRYSHAHPDNKVDRVILRTVIAPDGQGGAYLGFTLPAP